MSDKKTLKEICKFISEPLSDKQEENLPKFIEKVEEYVEKEINKIEEKQSGGYFFFHDEPKKKITKSIYEIERATTKFPEKYAGRKLISVQKGFIEKTKRTGINEGIIMYVNLIVFDVEKNGKICEENYGAIIHWDIKDFAISKPTTKLLNILIELVVDKKIKTGGLIGFSLRNVICNELRKKKIDITEHLSPIKI